MSNKNFNFNEIQNLFIVKILNAVKDKIPGNANDQLTQFFLKYALYYDDFSKKIHDTLLPELLGYALLFGFSLGQFSSDLKQVINELMKKWKEEFDKQKFENMYR